MPPATSRWTSYASPDWRANALNSAGTPPVSPRLRSVTVEGRKPSTGDPEPAVKLLPTNRIVSARAAACSPAIPSRKTAMRSRVIAGWLRLDLDDGGRAVRRIRTDPHGCLRRLDDPLVAIVP